MTAMAQLRRNMVDCQLRTYDVTQLAVLDAFETVPRDAFVPAAARDLAYLDRSVKLDGASGRALLTPMVSARMIQSLAPKAGERVLDYAGGTGYTAAILAHLGAEVTLVEPDMGLAATARTILASLGIDAVTVAETIGGLAKGFDAILVNGACDDVPAALLDLLAEDGRAIFIQGQGRAGRVMLAQKAGGRISSRPIFDAAAPLLAEFAAKPAFAL
jgi:protein-L-isoaspartate(D-aspartate) O-methyltransferase